MHTTQWTTRLLTAIDLWVRYVVSTQVLNPKEEALDDRVKAIARTVLIVWCQHSYGLICKVVDRHVIQKIGFTCTAPSDSRQRGRAVLLVITVASVPRCS